VTEDGKLSLKGKEMVILDLPALKPIHTNRHLNSTPFRFQHAGHELNLGFMGKGLSNKTCLQDELKVPQGHSQGKRTQLETDLSSGASNGQSHLTTN